MSVCQDFPDQGKKIFFEQLLYTLNLYKLFSFSFCIFFCFFLFSLNSYFLFKDFLLLIEVLAQLRFFSDLFKQIEFFYFVEADKEFQEFYEKKILQKKNERRNLTLTMEQSPDSIQYRHHVATRLTEETGDKESGSGVEGVEGMESGGGVGVRLYDDEDDTKKEKKRRMPLLSWRNRRGILVYVMNR